MHNSGFKDRYNFNPGQSDIVTQVPLSERGVVEESDLAHQFDQVIDASLNTQWVAGSPGEVIESNSNIWQR